MADGSGSAVRRSERRSARPIAVYLFVLALVALVPAFIFSALLLQRHNEAQERVVETLITGTARSIVQAVDRELNANATTLKVLATNPALLAGDMAEFHAQVSTALAGTGSYVYVLNRDLEAVMSTRRPYAPGIQGKSADPVASGRAFESEGTVVSDLVRGAVSQDYVVNVLQRVPATRLGEVVLGFNRAATQLAPVLLSNRLPEGWNVVLLDGAGLIIAASPGAGRTGDPFGLEDADTVGSSFGWRRETVEGTASLLVAQRSLLSDWTVVAWAPAEAVARPLADAFWSLLAGGVLLAAMVVLVVYWVGLQIGRSVHGLEADARRLGAGQPVEARAFPIAEIETISAALGDASRRRQAAESEVRFLMRELAHRSKNQMTVISAMAKQTARGADSVPEFVSSFEKRIHGLARSTDLLLAHGVAGVDLKELVISQIDPFCPVDGGRVTVDGPSLRLNAQAAQILGMAAHELATNAVKHGAFARDNGRLDVSWQRSADFLGLSWRESGLAAGEATAGGRRGFGTSVLENMVGRALGAEVRREAEDGTLVWRFAIPLAAIDPAHPVTDQPADK
ncbi:sensor histidine kinase [Devosia sp.]|uniref:sensor histidine kinase n=1 Tax=Devosia sp. TaxID=1871048 RepID=UPI0035B18CFF